MAIFAFNSNKTTDSILAVFQATIADLESVAEAEQAKAVSHDRVAATALALKGAAEQEASRAVSIATKMKAIFA